jgi:hypothetical protein
MKGSQKRVGGAKARRKIVPERGENHAVGATLFQFRPQLVVRGFASTSPLEVMNMYSNGVICWKVGKAEERQTLREMRAAKECREQLFVPTLADRRSSQPFRVHESLTDTASILAVL